MPGYVFLTLGDLTRIRCDYIVYTTDCWGEPGQLAEAFDSICPNFTASVSGWIEERGGFADVGESTKLTELPGGRTVIGIVSTRDVTTESAESAETAVREAIKSVPQAEVRRVIAFPAVNFGAGGNREARLKSAEAQLRAASEELQDRSDLDVLFITYDPSSYRVFQQARASLSLDTADLGIPQPPAALVDRLRRGQCVTFVGAGVSVESGLPNWRELLDYLEDRAGSKHRNPSQNADLMVRAQALRDEHQAKVDAWVRAKVSRPFNGTGTLLPSALHYTLASLPVRFYFTTNYDSLLEDTLSASKRFPITVVKQPEVAATGDSLGTYVVKLHGDATQSDTADPDAMGDENPHPNPRLVLSLDDYKRFKEDRGSMAALLRSLLLNQCFLFVGYGLGDPNIKELYREVKALLQGAPPVAYAITIGEQPNSSDFSGLESIPLADAREVRIYLDRLADAANCRPPMFLAPDVELRADDGLSELPRLTALADSFRQAGSDLERVIRGDEPLNEAESRLALEAAGFLVEHGWRPSNPSFKEMADQACRGSITVDLKRCWLQFVLRYCQDAKEAQAVWCALSGLDSSPNDTGD